MGSDILIPMIMISTFFSISLIFVPQSVFLTKLLVSVVWIALTHLTNSSHSVFLTASCLTSSLSYLTQQEEVLISQSLISLLYFSNCSNKLALFLIYQYLIYQLLILSLINQPINTCRIFQIWFSRIIR